MHLPKLAWLAESFHEPAAESWIQTKHPQSANNHNRFVGKNQWNLWLDRRPYIEPPNFDIIPYPDTSDNKRYNDIQALPNDGHTPIHRHHYYLGHNKLTPVWIVLVVDSIEQLHGHNLIQPIPLADPHWNGAHWIALGRYWLLHFDLNIAFSRLSLLYSNIELIANLILVNIFFVLSLI